MCIEEIKLSLIENIMSYLKYQLIDEIEEQYQKFPTFDVVLDIMKLMNKYTYSYTLEDIDDILFDKLILEVILRLKNN